MACLLCNQNNLETYTTNSFFGLSVLRCNNCDLYITGTSEKEVNDKLSGFYLEDFWNERKSEDSIKSDYTDTNSQGKKRNWISQVKYCKPLLTKDLTILEIGAGAGQNTFFFDQEGYDISAIEPDQRNVDLINQKLSKPRCIQGYVENFQFDKKYDCIWLSHVIEHLLRPDQTLQKIKNLLNPHGFIFIEVPNCGFKENLDKTIISQPHTFHFTKKSLTALAKKIGFQIVKCDCFRAATKYEGALNKLLTNKFPYYPRIKCADNEGKYLRIILKP
jgi:2-polyprenyl-3-methyl-5-hydroxy-6-metoxy-1,4-benzoquinol methylase